MKAKNESRNRAVDVVRGIAMLLVVLGHTISGTSIGYENTFVFRIIWTLQMPLFFIISGYVTRYSRPLASGSSLGRFMKKRTLAYLLPWAVWSFGVRGFIFGQHSFFDLRYLLYHMDSGYWFLVSLWSIVVIYGLADWLTNICKPSGKTAAILLHLVFCGCGMLLLGAVGYAMGISFFSIKLTLYYMPMYLCGYLYGQIQDDVLKCKQCSRALPAIYGIALAIWLYLIVRVNFYAVDMSAALLAMRYSASIFGTIALIGLIINNYEKSGGVFCLAGKYSLEIYLLHYLLLKPLSHGLPVDFMSLTGFLTVAAEYAITLGLVALCLKLITRNPALNKILFFKTAAARSATASLNGPA